MNMSVSRNESRATAYGVTDALSVSRPQADRDQAMWSAKAVSSIGTVNVTTLYKPGKLGCTLNELKRFRWDVVGVAETHWTGNGEFESDGVKILYSGRSDNIHREGVAFLLNTKAKKSYLEHRPVSSRIISLRMRGQHINTSIIQVYAPDSSHTDAEIEDFYEELRQEIQRINNRDLLIVMGDFNSKIGSDNDGFQDMMGPFGLGQRNERGEKLLEFCQQNELYVTNTKFYHRMNHRYTWTHPNEQHKSCIDYILIKKRWLSSVRGTKVMRSAELDTSHELLLSNIKLKFRVVNTNPKYEPRLNVEKLKEPIVRQQYLNLISENFAHIQQEENEVEDLWMKGSSTLKEKAKELLGIKRRIKQPWISEEILDICDRKREAKQQKLRDCTEENIETHRRLCREVDRKCREAKKAWIEKTCEKAEISYRNGQSRELHRIVREVTRQWKPNSQVIKDEQGEILSATEEVKERWIRHYKTLLTGNNEDVDMNLFPELAASNRGPDTANVMRCEVAKHIKSLPDGKAPGIDGLPGELLKAGGELVEEWITTIVQRIIQGHPIPKEWEHGLFNPVFKKGDVTECRNYRPICLLSHAYKVLAKVLHGRIQAREEEVLGEEQAGFRNKRGTTDQIFTLSQIAEKMWEYNKNLFCIFIDFRQAFDSVWRKGMIQVMKHFGFEEGIVNVIDRLYKETKVSVKKGNLKTDSFTTERGIIQGCPLSPHLFNIFLEKIMQEALVNCQGGVRIAGEIINNLRYADDIILVGETEEEVREMLDALVEMCRKYKLEINVDKTKVMKIGKTEGEMEVNLGNEQLEEVTAFKYLGFNFTNNMDNYRPIQERIKLGHAAMRRLRNIWNASRVTTQLKLKLFNTIVIPTVLYGAECWILNLREKRKLLAFEMYGLRRILKIRWQDRITNEEVRRRAGGGKSILERVQDAQLRWLGHVERMEEQRLPKKVFYGRIAGTRPRGRPKTTWVKAMKTRNSNVHWGELLRMARDRDDWRRYRLTQRDPTR